MFQPYIWRRIRAIVDLKKKKLWGRGVIFFICIYKKKIPRLKLRIYKKIRNQKISKSQICEKKSYSKRKKCSLVSWDQNVTFWPWDYVWQKPNTTCWEPLRTSCTHAISVWTLEKSKIGSTFVITALEMTIWTAMSDSGIYWTDCAAMARLAQGNRLVEENLASEPNLASGHQHK